MTLSKEIPIGNTLTAEICRIIKNSSAGESSFRLEEIGFNGEIYVCYDEFIDNEYQDKKYIRSLLDNEELFEEYLEEQ